MPSSDKEPYSPILGEPGGPIAAPVYNPGPGGVSILTNFIAQGIDQFKNDMNTRKASRLAAEKQRREDEQISAARDMFMGVNSIEETVGRATAPVPTPATQEDIYNTTLPLPQAIIESSLSNGDVTEKDVDGVRRSVQGVAEEIGNLRIAETQGSMQPLATNARIRDLMMSLLQKYETLDPKFLSAVLKENGISSPIFAEIEGELGGAKAVVDEKNKLKAEGIALGKEMVPLEMQVNMTDDDFYAIGHEIRINREKRKTSAEQLDIDHKKAQIEGLNLKAVESARNAKTLEQMQAEAFTIASQPINDIMGLLSQMKEPGSNPMVEAKFQEVLTSFIAGYPRVIDTVVQEYVGKASLEDMKALRGYLKGSMQPVLDAAENRNQSFGRIYKMFSDNMGLKVDIAMPLIAGLKAAGIELDYASVILEGMDKTVRDSLAKELIAPLRGSNTLITTSTARTWFNQALAVVRGQSSLNDMQLTSKEFKEIFSTAKRVNRNVGIKILSRTASDIEKDAFLNTQYEVVAQASDSTPGIPVESQANAIMTVLSVDKPGVTTSTRVALDSLIQAGSEDARYAGLGTRAAVSQLVIQLRSNPEIANSKFIKWNPETGLYTVRHPPKDRSTVIGANPFDPTTPVIMREQVPQPPAYMDKLAFALNTGIKFLVDSSNWDDTAPKGKPVELRAYYARGTSTSEMRKAATEAAKQKVKTGSKSPEAAFMKGADAFIQRMESQDFDLKPPTTVGEGGVAIDASGKAVMSETSTKMATAAKRLGYNSNVVAGILANVQHESRFDPSRVGDSGTAFGYFQHRKTRVDNFKKVTGVHPSAATPEQALKFFDWEMKNPEAAGMTQDEVDEILSATSPQEAAMLIQKHYERPKKVDSARGSTATAFDQALR